MCWIVIKRKKTIEEMQKQTVNYKTRLEREYQYAEHLRLEVAALKKDKKRLWEELELYKSRCERNTAN